MISYIHIVLPDEFKILPGDYVQKGDVLMVNSISFKTTYSKENCINIEYFVLDKSYMDLDMNLLSESAAWNLYAEIKGQGKELTESDLQEIFRVVNHLVLLDIKSKRNKLKEGGDENA